MKCEDHGIPQARHRLILLGVKSDIRLSPDVVMRLPLKAREAVTIDDVIEDLPIIRSMLSQEEDTAEKWQKAVRSFGQSDIMEYVKKREPEVHAFIDHTLALFPTLRSWAASSVPTIGKGHGGSRYTASGIGTTIF